MATPTDRERLAKFIGIDVKKKPLAVGADPDSYNPVVSQTGTTIAKALGVDTPQAAQQILDKPTIGDVTSNWIEEGYVNNSVPGWQKALASGPVGGFFNAVQKPLSLTSSLLKESVDLVTGQGFDFGDLRQQYNDNYTFGRLLHDYDLLQNRDSGWSKFGAAALGFIGDVALDPLTYIGMVGKPVALAAKLASSGSRNLSRKAVGETLKKATVGQIAARAGDDVVRTLDDGVFQQIGDAIASGAVANSSRTGRAGVRTGNTVIRRGKGGKGYQLDILGREAVEEGTQEAVVASIKIGDSVADDITDFYQISSKAQQKGASLLEPDELRRAAGFIARSELDEAGRAVGAQGYRGRYFTPEEAMNAQFGIGFKVPLTGPVGRALRVADPIANAINKVTRKGVSAPVGIRVMTSETPIIGKMAMSLPRGVRRAVNRAGTSRAGMALVGGKMNALKRTLRETTDAVAIQQGKRVIHAVGRGTATGRRIKPVLMSLVNDLAKTIDSVDGVDPTDVYYALGGDTAAINKVNAIDAELLPKAERTVAQLRAEANRAGGREFLSELENYVPRQLTDKARDAIQESLAATGRYNKRIHKNKGAYSGAGPELRRGYVDTDAFEAAAAKKAATEGITQEAAEAALKKEGTLTDKFFGEQLYKPGSTVDGDVIGSVEKQIADIIERNGGDYSLFVDDINVALRGWVDQVAPRVGEVATETILTQDGIIVQKLAEYVKFPSAAAITASKKLNKAEEAFSAATAKVVQRAVDARFAVGNRKALAQQALKEAERSAQVAEDALDAAVREENAIFSRESKLQEELFEQNAELDDIQNLIDDVDSRIVESDGEALVRLETERQKLVRDLDRVAASPNRIRYAYETVASATARKIHIEQQLRSIFGSGDNFTEYQRVMASYDASVTDEFPMEITLPDGSVMDENQILDAMGRLDEVLEMEDVSGAGLWMGVEREIDVLSLGNQVNNPANKAAYMLDKLNAELSDAVSVAQRYMDVTGEQIALPTPDAVLNAQQKIAEVVSEFDQAVQAGDRLPGELTEYLTNNEEIAQALKIYYASGDLPSPTYLPDMAALADIGQQVESKIAGRLNELSDEIAARGSQMNLSYVDRNGKEQVLTVRDYVYLKQMRNAIEVQKDTAQLPLGFSRPGIDELNVDWQSQAGSNPGGFATDANGNEYYVKQYNDVTPEGPRLDADGNPVPSTDRAAGEVLANAMYRELGFGAPDSYMSIGPDGSAYHIAPLIEDFQTAQLLQTERINPQTGQLELFPNEVTWNNSVDDLFVWTDPNTGAQRMGRTPPVGVNVKSFSLRGVVQQGFIADVLLSNWDAVGLGADNIGITPFALQEASVVRIDNGAAFFNRAQGLPKADSGWDFRSVSELTDERFQSTQVGGVPDVGLQSQQLDGVLALRARYGGWTNFVKRHAPELSESQVRKFSQFLEIRTENLTQRFNKSFLEAGSEDLYKSAYFSQGFNPNEIDNAFEGWVDPNNAYGPTQQTAKKDGYLPFLTEDGETQAIEFLSISDAKDKISEAVPLRSAQAVSVERDLSIADALEEYLYEPIEFDVDGSGFSQKDIDYDEFEFVDEDEFDIANHSQLWGGEAPENVSYGVAIIDDDGNVVIRMPSDDPASGEPFGGVKWTFPKGRPDGKESPFATAKREAFEETGLDVEIVAPLPGEFRGSTGSTFYFVGRLKEGAMRPEELMAGFGTTSVPTGGAMAPSPASLAASGNLEAEQLANVQMILNHTTRNGIPNIWQEYARMTEDLWGDKWGKNLTPGIVGYGNVADGNIYQLNASVPLGAQNIKIYGLPAREEQLAAQLTLQLSVETDPTKINSIAERLDTVVNAGKKEFGSTVEMAERPSLYGVEGLAPMMIDQWGRVLDVDPELASILINRLNVSPNVKGAFELAVDINAYKFVPDETVAPELAQIVQRVSSMDNAEQLELAINLYEEGFETLQDLLDEDGALEALGILKSIDSSTPNYLENRANYRKNIANWAVAIDEEFVSASRDAVTAAQQAGETYRSRPVEFQANISRSESDTTQRLHAQFIDVYKRSLSNDGYNMAAWMNRNDPFPSTVPGGPDLGAGLMKPDGSTGTVPNIVAVNPMSFGYKSYAGKMFEMSWQPASKVDDAKGFVGAPEFVQDFERMMEAQMLQGPRPTNLEEDPLEALVARQSEVMATVESGMETYRNSVAQLKSAERRAEAAAVDAAEKNAHAVTQRQIVMDLTRQQEKVDEAVETLNLLGIGEGVDINDIADDDLIALRQATQILINADADMNRLAFSEMENGADGFYDLISRTAPQRAELHRVANREVVLDSAFNSSMKPMGAIFQGPQQMVESMQAAERFVARGGPGAFFRKYDKLHNLLRAYMIMKPGFHMRNYFSGVFMNHLAGMDWSNYRRFMRAYWKFQEEEATRLGLPDKASKMRKQMRARGINPSNVSAEHVAYVRELAESGTLGGAGGQVATEFIDYSTGKAGKATVRIGGKKVNLLAAANPFSSQNALLQLSRNTGMGVETFLRGSLGFDALYKGGTADEAFENVMKFHFDYDDLSDFERNVVKKVVPFYTWTRKNLPLMFEMAARRPAIFNKYTSFKKEMEYGQERPKIVPKWMERQGAIQTPFKYEGENMFILPDMPFKQLLELVEPPLRFDRDESVMDRLQTTLETLGTQITPLVKAPYEWKAKQNLWKGYNFKGDYEVVPTAYAKVPFLMDLLSVPGIAAKNSRGQWAMKDYELHAMAQLMPTLSDLRRLFPDEERYQERSVSTWISFVFGAGLRTNTKWEQNMERRSRMYERRDEMDQERSLRTARLR